MNLTDDLRQRHARLSPYALKFLEFAAADPRRERRLDLWSSGLPDWVLSYPYQLQSWPTLLSGPKLREVSEVSTGFCRLIKSLPERLFEGDAERLSSYYGLPVALLEELLAGPSGVEGALARGDYIDTESGLKCLEMNLSAQIGGWQLRMWADAFLRCGPLAELVAREGLKLAYCDPFTVLLGHILDSVVKSDLAGPEVNVCAVCAPDVWGPHSPAIIRSFDQEYRALLGSRYGREGVFVCCGYDLLRNSGGRIYLGERRIHVLLEYNVTRTPPFVIDSFNRHEVQLYNGPMSRVWNDKRNLALLSEYQGSGLFDAGEEAFLRAHLPWTRLVVADFTEHQGERVYLPDFILARRESLVLKQALAARGEGVFIGRSTPAERWEKVLAIALGQNAWVVQEEVESLPYLYQQGESGAMLHDVVWGLFAFGDTFGGGFLRMIPTGLHGVINSAQGATEGIFFEVVEPGSGNS
ncbi:MAG TPA: hypothetical protein VFC23_13850 [Thermoanaerobaculia bacterium]|nr:hypothetical protein [Thermoanaerobaculia bacterium]